MKQNNFSWIAVCKLFISSKFLNWSISKKIQVLYDKNKRQIILLHLPRATGKFLKIVQVKTGELLSTQQTSVLVARW